MNKEKTKQLAKNARLEIRDPEKFANIDAVLELIEQINNADTDNIEPMLQPNPHA